MFTAEHFKQGMSVLDANGQHIGKVDHVQDADLALSREGFADNLHHFVPIAAVRKIENDTVTVDIGELTTMEEVVGDILHHRHAAADKVAADPLFGTSGHGTGMGGSGIGD